MPFPTKVWIDISMDFVEGLPFSKGYNCIMVVVDLLTKYAYFLAIAHHYTTAKVAQQFMANIAKLHGFPRFIISDCDPIFTSSFWKELFRLQGTKLSYSTAYHPQSDGQTQVVNKCLEQYLLCYTRDKLGA